MVDETFQIEKKWFEHMHEVGCGKSLQTKVERIFTPAGVAAAGWLDCGPVVKSLEAMKLTPLYSFANDESKGIVTITQEWAKSVQNSRCPSFKSVGTNANLKKIQTLMEAMLKHVPDKAGSSTSKVQTVGKAAMEVLFLEIAAKIAEGVAINLGHLKDFDTFHWLLTKEQIAIHKSLVAQCFKDGEARPAPVVQQEQQAPQKKAKKEPGESSTASLFKRRS